MPYPALPPGRWSHWLPPAILLALGAWWMWPLVTGEAIVGYRDSAYLYYPLLEALADCWGQGRVPLWNPWDNYGFPVVGDGSTAVFYPGKLVFALPGLSFASRYGIFLAGHWLWAAWGTYRLARGQRCHRAGATLAALAYAGGGPVLFQVTNVIFLVSAAWLPWALLSLIQTLEGKRWRAALATAACLAMMILGGDPQMVYHVGLIGVAGWCWRWATHWRRRQSWRAAVGLGLMVLVTSGLAAVQLLPTMELSAQSERAAMGSCVNLYSIGAENEAAEASSGAEHSNWYASLFQRTDQIPGQYEFSLPPWSLAELVVPNWSGRPFPKNQRWADGLVGADRMWFPSLYAGVLVALLALGRLEFRNRRRREFAWTWLAVWFTLGSFGWYGLTWGVRELALAGGMPNVVPDWSNPVGGVYWWMSTVLPGYVSFRYPAKLFVVASLAIAILAGRALPRGSQLAAARRMADHRMLVSAGIASLGAGGLVAWAYWVGVPIGREQSSSEFGPFDQWGAEQGLAWSMGQVGIVLITLVGLTWWAVRRHWRPDYWAWSILLLTAIDLSVANAWLVAPVPTATVSGLPGIGIEPAPGATWVPESDPFAIVASDSDDRGLERVLYWQRERLTPKHHLQLPVRLLGSFHSIWPTAYLDRVQRDLEKARQADIRSGAAPYRRLEWAAWPDGNRSSFRLSNLDWSPAPEGLRQIDARWDWNQAEFEVEVEGPAEGNWYELPVWGDSDWQIDVVSESVPNPDPIRWRVSSDHLVELWLQPGHYQVRLDYQGHSVWRGGVISLATCLLTALAWWWLPRRRQSA